MDVNIDYYSQRYFTFDKPIPFKQDLLMYPIKIEDYYDLVSCSEILTIDKNQVPDIKVISMTYLEFLNYNFVNPIHGFLYMRNLIRVLEMSFHVDYSKGDIELYEKKSGECYIRIKDTIINSEEFDVFKKLFMYQNFTEYDDNYIDPDLKEALEKYDRIANKMRGNPPTFEELLVCIVASTGYNFDDLEKLSYRKFTILLRKINEKLEYQINKQAEQNGFVSFKETIEHWLFSGKRDKFSGKVIDADSFKDKMKHVSQ